MATPGKPGLAASTVLQRLGLAFVLGALVGPYVSFTSFSGLDVAISSAALLLPPLVSVLLDPALRQARDALALVLVVVLVLGGLQTFLVLGDPVFHNVPLPAIGDVTLFAIAMTLPLLLVPVTAAFSAGGIGGQPGDTWGMAGAAGMMAWLGMGIHNLLPLVIIGAYSQNGPHSGGGNLYFAFAVVVCGGLYLVSIGVGALGGLVGGALRNRLT